MHQRLTTRGGPLVEVRGLGGERGVEAVTRQHECVGIEGAEHAVLDALHDRGEVAPFELRGPRPAREESVAGEQEGRPSTLNDIEPGVCPGV